MAKQVQLGSLTMGAGLRPVFLAEVGINHNGDMDKAIALTEAAIEAGADIVKFQHHLPEHEMVGNHEWASLMRDCQLSIQELASLKHLVESEGREFLCTPFCIPAASDLNEINVKGFKTGSGEANNVPFLEHVASFGKPMLISTGMTSRDELFRSLDAVRKVNPNVVLLNCTSTYPAASQEARIKRIGWLHSVFGRPVGQSDHTPTISTALAAIAMGAVCIEKHFTLDRTWEGPDQDASIIPEEFRQLVDMGNEVYESTKMCIEADFGILPREHPVRAIANHSVVTIAPVSRGKEFNFRNTGVMRPGTGDIPAFKLQEVFGRTATRNIDSGELLSYTDLA